MSGNDSDNDNDLGSLPGYSTSWPERRGGYDGLNGGVSTTERALTAADLDAELEEEAGFSSPESSPETSPESIAREPNTNVLPAFLQQFADGVDSPNDMQLDTEDILADIENEKEDVAIINADSDSEPATRASDFAAMQDIVLPPLAEDPPIIETAHHTWHIENWRATPRREHGPVFHVGGFPWRVLMFPFGNNVDHASFYLEQGFPEGKVPEDFVACVQFGLVLWNPDAPEIFTHHVAHHRFTKEEGDWGFTRFVESRRLWTVPFDSSGRFLIEDDKANMTAYVRVVKDETGVLWHNFQNYDSKKETGFVGLKNQGATCYLNSLIQSLYFTNAFRKAVYQIPTQNENTTKNSAYTLQRLFYQLQSSANAVSTSELTKSFGWETRHIFEQQDVQELSRKLMEKMEEKMKGTEAENLLPSLFCGKVRTYISCINVEYESRRVEDFWDVQLNVHGNKTLDESLKDYIQVETMEGENQYFAGDEHKLQDAKKGVIFEAFPEVLHLQLKRFEYDIPSDSMMKVNDRYEFPESFDAAPFLSDGSDMSESWIYQLHGVLVHSGDLNAGHYYAFIKPTKDGWFYKFDDDKVTKATMREVLDENFGGEYMVNGQPQFTSKNKPIMRQNSAYMLVYIRQTRLDRVLMPVTELDTPPHLQKKLDDEAADREARKKERDEQHLYLNVKVITEDSFKAHGGTDLTNFDLNHDEVPAGSWNYRILRKSTLAELATKIGEDTSTDPKRIRLWSMVSRQNKTTRPDAPIPESIVNIEDAYQRLAGNKAPELRLWAEVAEETTPDGEAVWPASYGSPNGVTPKSDLIVLFLKWFNLEEKTLSGVGHIYISREKKVEELVPVILKKMDWPEKSPTGEKTSLRLYEEIKPNMIEPMKGKQSLKAAELQDGDIVCFQKATPPARGVSDSETESVKSGHDVIETAPQYYDFLVHKRLIRFYPHPSRNSSPEKLESFDLLLSAKHTYDQLSARVGERLSINPTHIRFWTVNSTSNNAKASVKRTQALTLAAIMNPPYSTFSNNNQRSDALFYELLDISLTELDTKKALKVTWLSEGISKEEIVDLLVPKNGTVVDVVQALVKKAQLDEEAKAGPIRVYESTSGKLHRELPRNHPVNSIGEYTTIILERIPDEELDAPPAEIINAFHYQNEPNKSHGIPFKFRIKEGEKFSDTKTRLEKRTGIKGKNFEKIKFSVVRRSHYSKPQYLSDDDILWDVATSDDDMLGLDHMDRTRKTNNGGGDLFLR
ncbi:Ubiquitin carboxyl-terminal hydrolase [Lachnellula suecica]|uniref:ubiquitinyl hydrolase 1 n=1 Tax=Lachnellula suecica TaxID=602035 RepID=A0A8T9CH06_9HELO|nr:Ubiquitin carboxyl-terminal hydrolase [Lachnellula suecica]